MRISSHDHSIRLPRRRPTLHGPHVRPHAPPIHSHTSSTHPPAIISTSTFYIPLNFVLAPHNPRYQNQANTQANSPSIKPDQFSETPGVKKWIDNYLWVGETVMDQSVAFFSSSSYFERKR
jgi:hypothetical protein